MKIIVSHDVDHLYATDHFFRDLILEKLWVRSFIHLCQGKISFRTFWYRLTILFHNRMHRIDEVMAFDQLNAIPSTFFFGMTNGLGMSYPVRRAVPEIKQVLKKGFEVGVHGMEFQDVSKIIKERERFKEISKLESFGIRMHYVRYDNETFHKLEKVGYLYDSTQFNKDRIDLLPPNMTGKMWEFPLHIMDVYVCKPGELEKGIRNTTDAICEADVAGLPFFTILFHDHQFDDNYDPQMKKWYSSIIQYCKDQGYEFVSYKDAIKELESHAQ